MTAGDEKGPRPLFVPQVIILNYSTVVNRLGGPLETHSSLALKPFREFEPVGQIAKNIPDL